MIELHDFYNEGYGWICRHCERQSREPAVDSPSRLLSEGEAEGKQPRLSTVALAKWADPEQRTLVCPRCGISEMVDVS